MCEAAAAHGGACVDVRPLINGASLTVPGDENSEASMRAIADALNETGLSELGLASPTQPGFSGTVTAIDVETCDLDLNDPVNSGVVRLEVINQLPPPYAVAFDMFKLPDDFPFDQFHADMQLLRDRLTAGEPYAQVADDGYPEYLTSVTAVELPRNGMRDELVATLEAGQYVIECTVPVEASGEFWPVVDLGPIQVE
jgi:hypothetical protein